MANPGLWTPKSFFVEKNGLYVPKALIDNGFVFSKKHGLFVPEEFVVKNNVFGRFKKGLLGVVLLAGSFLATPKAGDGLDFKLLDVSTAHRVVNPDSSSFLEYGLARDTFLAGVVDDNGDTVVLDTVVQEATGVGEKVLIPENDHVRVSPNGLELLLSSPGDVSVEWFDVGGRFVGGETFFAGAGYNLVKVPKLGDGVYFPVVKVDGRTIAGKVLLVDNEVVGSSFVEKGSSRVSPIYSRVLTPDSLEARLLSSSDSVNVFVRELSDTLNPPTPGDTSQEWIGSWYNFKARMPSSVLDLDTLEVIMIPYQPLTASDSLGNLYFPGGWLHGMKKLTNSHSPVPVLSRLVRWNDFNNVPIKLVTITGNGSGVPLLNQMPQEFEAIFDSMVDRIVQGTDSLLPLMFVPFDSSMVSPPLPDTLPYGLDGDPDNVYNVMIYVFGTSGELGHGDNPGNTTHYYHIDEQFYPTDIYGVWIEIDMDYVTSPGLRNLTLRRETGRGIGFQARGPPPYIMAYPNTGTTNYFHPDEFLIMKLFYGLPNLTKMSYYKTND